ncbi:MAG: hypothetical protein ABH821_03120 [archaeon]
MDNYSAIKIGYSNSEINKKNMKLKVKEILEELNPVQRISFKRICRKLFWS